MQRAPRDNAPSTPSTTSSGNSTRRLERPRKLALAIDHSHAAYSAPFCRILTPKALVFRHISHIKTPQQFAKPEELQRTLEPGVKPKSIENLVKTRWNAYGRGAEMQAALNTYIYYHIDSCTDLAARAKELDASQLVKKWGVSHLMIGDAKPSTDDHFSLAAPWLPFK